MTWFRPRRTAPPARLSVVVPVFQVEDWLADCLDSILAAPDAAIEVVVVDDGSTDRSRRIAERVARRDARLRVVSQPNAGLSAARNTGVRHAAAPYLTFVDSDDLVEIGALLRAVDALDESGSDLALLLYAQLKGGRMEPPAPWIRAVHDPGPRTTSLAAEPRLTAQTTAWAKVYRRSFWDAAGLTFREGALFEDQDSTAVAYVAAGAIDVVPLLAYRYRVRPRSIMRRTDPDAVAQFFDAIGRALVTYAAVPGARAARASQVLSNDVPRMLRTLAETDDPAYRDALLVRVTTLLAEPGLDLADAPAEARVVYALLRAGRAADVPSFVARGGFDLASLRSDEVDGRPALAFPFTGDPDVPDTSRILSERQTPLDAMVLRARLDASGLRLTVAAWLRHVDGDDPTLRAWLVGPEDGEGGGTRQAFTVARSAETAGPRLRTTRRSNERSVWDLVLADPGPGRLEVEVTHHGRTRRAEVTRIDPAGSAAVPQAAGGLSLTGAEPWAVGRDPVSPWAGDLTDPAAVTIPAEPGESEVPGTVDQSLAVLLPWEADLPDRRAQLVLAGPRRLKVVVRPAAPLEELTVWGRRDHPRP